MSDTVIIRVYHKGDETKIVELIENVSPGWPGRDIPCSKVEFWRWKYLDNHLKMNNISVALVNDGIIGANQGIYLNLKLGEKILLCSQGTDGAVHLDFQGRRIYTKLAEPRDNVHEENKRAIDVSLVGNQILIDRSRRRGHHFFQHEMLDMLRVNNIWLHLSKTKTKYPLVKGAAFLCLSAYHKLRSTPIRHRAVDFKVFVIRQFDERINNFWNTIKDEYVFIYERSKVYLNWRYCDPRAGEYTVLQAENDEQVLGYTVLKINKFKEYHTGNIIDILSIPRRNDVYDALLESAVKFFEDLNVNAIRCWVIKDQPVERLMYKQGFVGSSLKTPSIIFKPVHVGAEWQEFLEAPPDKIHLQMGDTEWM